MRPLGEEDFISIVTKGLSKTLDGLDFGIADPGPGEAGGEQDHPARRIEAVLTNRVVRDANFRRSILAAYDETCAVTGFRIKDSAGRVEAQAAHILPVASDGPDVVQNGIALCATMHWLFDRHLISIGEDWCLLVAQDLLPQGLLALLPPDGTPIRRPTNPRLWPDDKFLRVHRRRFAEVSMGIPEPPVRETAGLLAEPI
jgi:putative restriction endonuclease